MSREETNATKTSPLMDVSELATYLNLSTSKVYKDAEAGKIPCFRIGAALRFSRRQIVAWLNDQQDPK
jgi:excisionase family DNA binding protein